MTNAAQPSHFGRATVVRVAPATPINISPSANTKAISMSLSRALSATIASKLK